MGLPLDVFARRRHRLMQVIGNLAVAVFPAAPPRIRSNDVEYRYRQHSDFLYLTGFREPGAVCLLEPGGEEEYVLFVEPHDPERETWTGRRIGVDGAVEAFGASAAYPIDALKEKLPERLAGRDRVYYAFDRDTWFNERMVEWVRRGRAARPRTGSGPIAICDPRAILHDMRVRKDAEELCALRRAVATTVGAHIAAMRAVRPQRFEYEIEALIEYHFRRAGAQGPAYPSIVASGVNATVLHYTDNRRRMGEGDLVLIDAGAEQDDYCADVTRTFPVGVRFEPRARALYEVVLRAQRAAIAAVAPGVPVDKIHDAAVGIVVDGLLDLGLLKGSAEEVREQKLYKPFYMHRTSHWLGMDVHDVGQYRIDGEARRLEAGIVLTVEPGIYLADHIEGVPSEWQGLGVRIEDDVIVTDQGREVLSEGVPKDVAEIEALRRDACIGEGGRGCEIE